ncbi:hypothetical protein ABHF33_10100 [Chitinibacter sp. FCG-7]|uniref:DUF4145 domain-containing protein n=1 Tax=Chitinibacter mangrovi TaxID=3153927 RepID=A0AAU7F6N3_9NEIS
MKDVASIEEIFEIRKLNTSSLSIGASDNINFTHRLPLMPEDYLRFAHSDLKEGSARGLINALSNAKRSIDSIIEIALKSLSIDPRNIPAHALEFCNDVLPEWDKNINPTSLRIFCALGFSPSLLIKEVRSLRNNIEHDYEIPSIDETIKAVEIAELLLNTLRAKEMYNCCIEISDTNTTSKIEEGRASGIRFRDKYSPLKNTGTSFELIAFNENNQGYCYTFTGKEPLYYYFLRAMIVADLDREKLKETILKIIQITHSKKPPNTIKIAEFDY